MLGTSAGEILQHQMPEEMGWVVSRELAHAIGQYTEEEDSWLLLGVLLFLVGYVWQP